MKNWIVWQFFNDSKMLILKNIIGAQPCLQVWSGPLAIRLVEFV